MPCRTESYSSALNEITCNDTEEKKPSCFISYCHEDTNKDAILLLVEELRALSSEDIVFHWDRNQVTGSKLVTFMDKLYTADAVILLLSPAYKRKVDERIGGVYEEYERIMGRLDDVERLRRKRNKGLADIRELRKADFTLFPYIFVGSGDTACPHAFADRKYEALTQWHVHKDSKGNLYIADFVKSQLKIKSWKNQSSVSSWAQTLTSVS